MMQSAVSLTLITAPSNSGIERLLCHQLKDGFRDLFKGTEVVEEAQNTGMLTRFRLSHIRSGAASYLAKKA